jgi:putative redox protein
MSSSPRKISEIIVEFDCSGKNYSKKEQKLIENLARTCPVALSLDPSIKQTLSFIF